ncbi:MAG: histidine phosphatase family protein [Gammaproteobacteria bacterium]|jgi:broad specificity phosphatase PhoE|nr:histidine phosphatase family protein [Gammaproteobacteria bacterium]MCP4881233.1 histidine phosphatase family protein [Gammaproteobacteria bacterium]MDP6164927.1 histidine phosphatase family protein [Gammaproteobacteria bacterium]
MSSELRLTLLRHGHTTSGPVYRGRVDSPLSDKGWQQMRESVKGIDADMVVASPLQRCAGFAEQLGPPLLTDDRLMEMDFGEWDGRDREEVWQQDKDAVKAFWANPMQVCPPGGENLTQVQERASAALHEHVQSALAQNKQHLLLVSHGGVIRCLIGKVLQMKGQGLFHLYVPYAGLAHFTVSQYARSQEQDLGYHISLDLGKRRHDEA